MAPAAATYTPPQHAAADTLPGVRLLELQARTPVELVDELERGLPARDALRRLQQAVGATEAELAGVLGMSLATLHRRKSDRQRLRADESARAYRLARLTVRAAEVLRSEDDARAWLRQPVLALGQRTPLELAASEVGAELVLQVLGRLEHGVYT